MSVHYVLDGDSCDLQDKNVKLWHDEDGEDNPVYNGRYGDLLLEMADSYATDKDIGIIWSEMDEFNDDFADETPRVIAFNVFKGSRVVTQYPEDSKKHDPYGPIVTIPGFDPGGMLYGRCGDSALMSFQNWRCLEWWLAKVVNIDDFLRWVAGNNPPDGKNHDA